MSTPYTRKELREIGDQLPQRGWFCPRCNNYIPEFADLSPEDSERFRSLANIEPVRVMGELRKITGCPLAWAKLWVHHSDGIRGGEKEDHPCPYCKVPLAENAKQCLLCKMDWHDAENPIRRGDSMAEVIMNAQTGATIEIEGRIALQKAMHFTVLFRPDAQLKFELIEIKKK